MTPQVLVRYLESIFNDSSSIGQIPIQKYFLEKYMTPHSMTPQVLVRYLEKYIQ